MTRHKRLDQRLIQRQRDFVYRQVYQTAQAFARIEASSGIALLIATIIALVWANSPWQDSYFDLWHSRVLIDTEILNIDLDLQGWVNDALMTIFFLLVGLEIKRELVHGELASPRRALLPAAAALGGMVAPALIYTAFNVSGAGAHGWGVPMATDIAFALGALSLLGRRIPASIRAYLLALAIADDIGAILVIAVFYTEGVDFLALAVASVILVCVYVANRAEVRHMEVYVVLGALLWVATLQSGIHPTIAGVILGLLTPATQYFNPESFPESSSDLSRRFDQALAEDNREVQEAVLGQMKDLAQGSEAPLERIERALVNWVSFLIVPLFALANAGVHISGDVAADALKSAVSQGVVAGLVVGKPLGIFLLTWLAVRSGLCEKPRGASWSQVLGVGMLGGIGFTISLLISGLAFPGELFEDEAKLGILCGSLISGFVGVLFLLATSRQNLAPALLEE